jgi:hypothetical protein
MKNIDQQKIRLEQKKNRLVLEEARLKINQRKMRTRHLIELGGLIVKAQLDHLPTNSLYGALLSIAESLKTNQAIKEQWTKIGKDILDQQQKNKQAVILKFATQPPRDIRELIRAHSLKWNHLRQEWYGYLLDLDSLKQALNSTPHHLEIINDN